jgi:hypothetical protein
VTTWRRALAHLLLMLSLLTDVATADPLAATLRILQSRPLATNQTDLAVHFDTAGHWSFANRAGERFTASITASGPLAEVSRALATLAPDRAKTNHQLAVYLSQASAFDTSQAAVTLAAVTRTARVYAVIGDTVYPATLPETMAGTPRSNAPLRFEIARNCVLSAASAEAFTDALHHLTRPLSRQQIRVLAFAPGAPSVLSSQPRIDPLSKTALVDQIEPAQAAGALAQVRGQILLVTGRVDNTTLLTKSNGQPETAVNLTTLAQAATAVDATLVVLQTGNTAQPGGRNLLWLPVKIPGLDGGQDIPSLLDIIALTTGNRPLEIAATPTPTRLQLDIRTPSTTEGLLTPGRWRQIFSDVTSDLLGKAQARELTVYAPTATRQRELDRRVVKAIPSALQYAYAALLVLGVCGWPVAWRWWARLWPHETAADYAGATGFHAARVVRAAIFAVVFMPLTAIVAAPFNLLRRLRRNA